MNMINLLRCGKKLLGIHGCRGYKKWVPDAEDFKFWNRPLPFSDDDINDQLKIFYNQKLALVPRERKLANTFINFGPAHPAAHGVLRMVLELEGEVKITF